MSIYTKPYTYLIGWSSHQMFYYGVRYAKGCDPTDLWTKYFTSSKHVQKFYADHGEPDVVEVRRLFESKDAAKDWEHKVLRRMKVVKRQDFLNRSNARCASTEGYRHTSESRQKISATNKKKPGRKWTDEQKLKASASHKGLKFSDEHRKNISSARVGIVFSDEHRRRLSASHTGKIESQEATATRAIAIKAFYTSETGRSQLSAQSTLLWANRTDEQRAAIGAKIAATKAAKKLLVTEGA